MFTYSNLRASSKLLRHEHHGEKTTRKRNEIETVIFRLKAKASKNKQNLCLYESKIEWVALNVYFYFLLLLIWCSYEARKNGREVFRAATAKCSRYLFPFHVSASPYFQSIRTLPMYQSIHYIHCFQIERIMSVLNEISLLRERRICNEIQLQMQRKSI